MMPMPAVTLVQRTIHSSQNCRVRKAEFTSTLCVVIKAECCAGPVQSAGRQSSAGTRMVKTPNIMKMK